MKRLLFSALFLLFCAASSQAMPGGMSGSFDRADTNKDGYLNWEEFHAAFSSLKREAFDLIDTDKDGRISKDEWNAFRVGHGMSGTPSQIKGGATGAGNGASGPAGISGTTGAPGGLPLLDAPVKKPAPAKTMPPPAQAAPAAKDQKAPLPLLNAPAAQAQPAAAPAAPAAPAK